MERAGVTGKDVIIHRNLTLKEREEELRKLKEESENLKSWEEDEANGSE